MAKEDTARTRQLASNTQLVRRQAIRNILGSRDGEQGVSTYKELIELLDERGLGCALSTVDQDLKELGAIKVQKVVDGKLVGRSWYVLPGYTGEGADVRAHVEAEVIEGEVSALMVSAVRECFVHRDEVVLHCRQKGGPLVAYWLKNLNWTEMVYVFSDDTTVAVRCRDEAAAQFMWRRLVGQADVTTR